MTAKIVVRGRVYRCRAHPHCWRFKITDRRAPVHSGICDTQQDALNAACDEIKRWS